jgi:glutamyl-tRNA reductase
MPRPFCVPYFYGFAAPADGAFLSSVTIVVVGCSHTTAPLPLLERIAVPSGELDHVLRGLKRSVREAIVLSTCNRTEIYAVVGHAGSGAERMERLLAERAGLPPDEFRRHATVRVDRDAVQHALAVASGLESLVLGEDQIQAQWKRALAHARLAEALGPVLDRLGAAALACGKRVRTFTGVGRHSVSLESLAVRAAAAALDADHLGGRRVLVVGSGESAALIVRHLRAADGVHVTVTSRSIEKAQAFADAAEASVLPVGDIAGALPAMDAVFCCTAAPHPVLELPHFAGAPPRAAARPLACVDLGMPRDVEQAVADVPGVRLIGMAQLAALAEQHRMERRAHVPAAEAIVASETTRFLEWKTARGSAAAIARLHAHARAVAELELNVALARLNHLHPRDREVVSAMARRIVNKLLHAPSTALQEHPEAENLALALEYAFGLRGAACALHDSLPQDPAAPVQPAAADPIKDTA